jgi:putative transposase
MEVLEVKRLKSLEEENTRLKKLLAEAMLDKEALQVALGESTDDRPEAGSRDVDVMRPVCRNVVPAGLQVYPCRPAAMRLTVRLLMRIYQAHH